MWSVGGSVMPPQLLRADGSAAEDARRRVTIDRTDPVQRYRYRCPRGHIDWDATNNHVWCRGCRRRYEAGDSDADPEHWHVVDEKSGEKISWSRIDLVE